VYGGSGSEFAGGARFGEGPSSSANAIVGASRSVAITAIFGNFLVIGRP
jgi:hypothetical protein